MESEFTGHLLTFDKKGNGDEIVDENVMIECTQLRADGRIELAFMDRNERCFLAFDLADLMRHMARVAGEKVE